MSKQAKMYLACGVLFGAVVGVVSDNIGFWLSIGVAIGAGLGAAANKRNQDDARNGERD